MLTMCLLVLHCGAKADNEELLSELDAAIEQREQYIHEKEERIALLKKQLEEEDNSTGVLRLLDRLFSEYYVFKFDSAMAYADKGVAMARQMGDDHYKARFAIHRSEILAVGGLYQEATANLDALEPKPTDRELLFNYYFAYYTIYNYWSDYCHGTAYSPEYRSKASSNLEKALQYADTNSPQYEYYQGEINVYVEPDGKKARQHYLNLLEHNSGDSRIYAMAAFALAGNYWADGDNEKYVEYMTKAALSDVKCCIMENLALQYLAIHLFDKGEDYIGRAERYINVSMEDAKFYNNRLRILEISQMLPQIMTAYQQTVEWQNQRLRYSIGFISFLVLGLLLTAYYIYRQNRKLSTRRRELADNNQQLSLLNQQLADSNQHQADLNEQLQELNQRLVDTNKRRENLAYIYIDLCAKYIDKLSKYQTLVKRKIKANQAQELLRTISSTRISEEDAAIFLTRFDKAFLELYPTFVDEFNSLLQEDGRIQQKSPFSMTTELRTFALIRLGVKNTADIAGLLFLSMQTIYNCRSAVKNKALCKETFDEDVNQLCMVISN